MALRTDVLGPLQFEAETFDIPDETVQRFVAEVAAISGVTGVDAGVNNKTYVIVVSLRDTAPAGHIRQRVRDLIKQFSTA